MSKRTLPAIFVALILFVVLALAGSSLQPGVALAQSTFPAQAVVIQNANIRGGPGTAYPIVGKATIGQVLILAASNANGSWYQLDDGNWIAAFLVVRVAPGAAIATLPATPTDVLIPLPGTPGPGSVPDAGLGLTATLPGDPAATLLPPAPVAPPVVATPPLSIPLPVDAQPVQVLDVFDGGTVLVQLGAQTETVRYIGVAAPLVGDPGHDLAVAANRSLVAGQTVYLVREQSDRTPENQLLRHLLRADGTIVGAQLIADGWALPLNMPPDTARSTDYMTLAVAAAAGKRGFWGAAPDTNPAAYALTVEAATLFEAPSGASAADAVLAANLPVALLGRTADGAWVRVRAPRRDEGWVFVPQLAANVPISLLPVIYADASGPTPMPALGQATPAPATPLPGAGFPTPIQDPALAGFPTPIPDPNLAGFPTPIQDPNLAGFPTPIQDPNLAGFPTPIQNPGLPVVTTPVPGVVPGTPVVNRQANLRSGPGTEYPVTGVAALGAPIALTGQNQEGTWYQTAANGWIGAALVSNAPVGLPIVPAPPLPTPAPTLPPTPVVVVPPGGAPPATPTPTPTMTPVLQAPLASPTAAPVAAVKIIAVNRAAEWVLLYNDGTAGQDLAGWLLKSEKDDQQCLLNGTIAPRGALRVWAGSGPDGLSCGLPGDVWDNVEADAAILVNAAGEQVSRFP